MIHEICNMKIYHLNIRRYSLHHHFPFNVNLRWSWSTRFLASRSYQGKYIVHRIKLWYDIESQLYSCSRGGSRGGGDFAPSRQLRESSPFFVYVRTFSMLYDFFFLPLSGWRPRFALQLTRALSWRFFFFMFQNFQSLADPVAYCYSVTTHIQFFFSFGRFLLRAYVTWTSIPRFSSFHIFFIIEKTSIKRIGISNSKNYWRKVVEE